MIIRNEQMVSFQQIADRNFEDGVIRYLQGTFPVNCRMIGEDNLRSVVQFGRKRAEANKCFEEQSIITYIHLMFMLGGNFDSDPLLPWAFEILNDKPDVYEVMRINSLWQKAHEYIFSVNGKDNEHLFRAMHKMREYPFMTSSNDIERNFIEHVLYLLKSLYREKYDFLGEAILTPLIQDGTSKAAQYGITSKLGIRVIIIFMFMLGSGFDTDPLQLWAGTILRDDTIKDPDKKLALLRDEALKQLNAFLPAVSVRPTSAKIREV